MRVLVLPLLLLASALAATRAPEPPRPIIVLVHGRGQTGADSAVMRREWKGELDSALALAGFPRLREDDVRFAWYADVMDPSVAGACDRSYATQASLGDMARGFLVSLVSVIPDSGRDEDRQARSLIGDMLYLVDPSTRCAAETRFGNVMATARAERRPVIVVAYSLGAAVAYGHLARSDDTTAAVQLITLGSPLAVPIARELLLGASTLRVPSAVARWVNIHDPDDAFAAPLGLSGTRAVDRAMRGDRAADPHQVNRYLRDVETGRALAEAMCGTTANTWSAGCAGLGDGRR